MNKFKQYLIFALIIAIAMVGVMYFMNTRSNKDEAKPEQALISNYQECIDAGYPSMESYPAQCKTPDGQSFAEDIGNENEMSDIIRIENPRPNQSISHLLQIKGTARGSWFFEADFPAHLIDANGKEIAVTPVTTIDDWMTTNFIPFLGTMTFTKPNTTTGTLILKKANPSGLLENERELRIPVKFSK